MNNYPKWERKPLIILLISVVLLSGWSVLQGNGSKIEADFSIADPEPELSKTLSLIQENSLLPVSNPSNPEPKVAWKMPVVITAYSSSPWETDDSPYITAAGTWVKDGIIANNFLSFGTKIRIPEIYGDKVFTVEDRMSWEKSNYHIDIWFSSSLEAKEFGIKMSYIEILES